MCWWPLTPVTLVARGRFGMSTTKWLQKYKNFCDSNEWEDATKATVLEREALAIWLELTTEEKASYATSKGKIITKMAPMRFMSLNDFSAQRLNPGKSLSVFLHKLSKKAMPDAETTMRNQLLLHQFISGLPAHIGKQLQATGEVINLDRMLEWAKLLMTIEEPQKTAACSPN